MVNFVPSIAFIANVVLMKIIVPKRTAYREQVREALEARLIDMQQNGPKPDVLTFAGNGEPTAHPHFAGIIEDTLALRDIYFPQAKVSVLSNSTLFTNRRYLMH